MDCVPRRAGNKESAEVDMQGYLAHKNPPPPRIIIGSQAWGYCRVLRGGVSYERGTPVSDGVVVEGVKGARIAL